MAFGFGFSSFTDLIGLTDPIVATPAKPRIYLPAPVIPNQPQQQQRHVGQFESSSFGQEPYHSNLSHPGALQTPGNVSSNYPTTAFSNYNHGSLECHRFVPPPTSVPPPVQVGLVVPPTPNLSTDFSAISSKTATSTAEVLYDPTRRSASPTSSGVQIDLINLRQKLCREIQNNMDLVEDQQKNIQALQKRADTVETQYAHLKLDMEDLKRKSKDQESKLKEIDMLLRSALTMTSFSCAPSELHVEMVGEDKIAVTAAVAEATQPAK